MVSKLKHKFGAIKCERDGIKFPSKLERACFDWLVKAKENGRIRNILRQVPFDIPGGKHVVDFLVFTYDEALFIEAKGKDLSQGKFKRKAAEEVHKIPIHVVTSVAELEQLLQNHNTAVNVCY